ncbi:hypothetical protein Peur_026237 [Populus x canadensis]
MSKESAPAATRAAEVSSEERSRCYLHTRKFRKWIIECIMEISVGKTARNSTGPKRRIEKELKDLMKNPQTHCSSGPVGDHDIFKWQAIMGSSYTPLKRGCLLSFHRVPC